MSIFYRKKWGHFIPNLRPNLYAQNKGKIIIQGLVTSNQILERKQQITIGSAGTHL